MSIIIAAVNVKNNRCSPILPDSNKNEDSNIICEDFGVYCSTNNSINNIAWSWHRNMRVTSLCPPLLLVIKNNLKLLFAWKYKKTVDGICIFQNKIIIRTPNSLCSRFLVIHADINEYKVHLFSAFKKVYNTHTNTECVASLFL